MRGRRANQDSKDMKPCLRLQILKRLYLNRLNHFGKRELSRDDSVQGRYQSESAALHAYTLAGTSEGQISAVM